MLKFLKNLFGGRASRNTEPPELPPAPDKRSPGKTSPEKPSPPKKEEPKTAHVEVGYKTGTASTSTGGFRSEQDLQQFVRQNFKFTDCLIEGVRCANLDRKFDGKVYEVYHCQSRSKAIQFLKSIPFSRIPPRYYIIVETPQGNVGKDLEIIFDEPTGQEIP